MVIILSFPRSGNHFVRYLVELLTGRATIGANGFTEPLMSGSVTCLITLESTDWTV